MKSTINSILIATLLVAPVLNIKSDNNEIWKLALGVAGVAALGGGIYYLVKKPAATHLPTTPQTSDAVKPEPLPLEQSQDQTKEDKDKLIAQIASQIRNTTYFQNLPSLGHSVFEDSLQKEPIQALKKGIKLITRDSLSKKTEKNSELQVIKDEFHQQVEQEQKLRQVLSNIKNNCQKNDVASGLKRIITFQQSPGQYIKQCRECELLEKEKKRLCEDIPTRGMIIRKKAHDLAKSVGVSLDLSADSSCKAVVSNLESCMQTYFARHDKDIEVFNESLRKLEEYKD